MKHMHIAWQRAGTRPAQAGVWSVLGTGGALEGIWSAHGNRGGDGGVSKRGRERRGHHERPGPTPHAAGSRRPLREGYPVHESKEAFADELFARCRVLRLPPDLHGRPNLRELGRHAGIKGPNTLIAALASPGYPRLETLRLLEEHAGLPLPRSLRALGLLTRATLAAELGIDPQAVPDVPPAVRRLMESWAALPAEQARDLLDALRAVLGPDSGDNTPGPSPTRADPP